ncbi:MAG: hypothetical protein ACJZ46_05625 [Candidatus Thalassarchaeaceae archaeon]|tara:strand:+ start:1709 stop:2509 length:801 start_codon:yes stop_codon:yes gene_type:complete
MAIESVPLYQQQIAFAIGLLGVYAGWRGTISKMTGFFDLSGAAKNLLYGIVVGMIFAVIIDSYVLFEVLNFNLNIFTMSSLIILISISESAFVLFILGRPRVVALRASPPNGWALGLGMGSMHSSVLIVRLFDDGLNSFSEYSGFSIISLVIALSVSISACLGHALINTWQGTQILDNRRFKPLLLASIVRGILTTSLLLCLFIPLIMIAIIPILALSWSPAQENWMPSGMTPAAKQAFRRTLRQSEKHKIAADHRIKGDIIYSEE